MYKIFSFLALMVFSFSVSAQIKDLSPKDFERQMMPGAQILDVRTPEEYSSGFIKSSTLANWNIADDFQSVAMKLDREKPVFVYCRSGGRSASAAKWLEDQGFKTVYNLEGGITAWKKAGLPIVENE